jgi:hypothetical protein
VLTALLWTTLIASTVLLVVIASPIRLSLKAVYGEDGRNTELRAAIHCLHPLILKAEYSSTEERVRLFIFGFEKKHGVKKDGQGDTDINTDSINSINNADSTGTDNINTDGIYTDDANTDGMNTNSVNTDAPNTDGIDTKNINTPGSKENNGSLISKIMSKINDIKRHKVYKITGNRPLREKLLRRLKRSLIRVTRVISIEKLKLHVRAGLRDPATLGKMYGYFAAANSALALQRCRVDLSMTPVFTQKCLYIDSELKIRTTLSVILWQLTAIAAIFPYWEVRKIIKS